MYILLFKTGRVIVHRVVGKVKREDEKHRTQTLDYSVFSINVNSPCSPFPPVFSFPCGIRDSGPQTSAGEEGIDGRSHTGCVTLGKSLNLSEPQLLPHLNGG